MRRLLILPLLFLFFIPAAQAQDGPKAFSVETVNAGLGEVPEMVDRETPQSSLESFLQLTGRGDFEAAAHHLDLRGVEEATRTLKGTELARQLADIIEARVWIPWGRVTDRPDGLIASGDKAQPLIGEPRRSVSLAQVDIGNRPVSIRMNRLQAGDADPVWVFSRQTVGNVPELFGLYGTSWIEELLPQALRTDVTLGLEWWELLAFPLLLIASLSVAVMFYRGIGALAKKAPNSMVWKTVSVLRIPLTLAAAASVFYLCSKYVFAFNAILSTFLQPTAIALFVLAIAILVIQLLDTALEFAIDSNVEKIESEDGKEYRDFYTNMSAARRVIVVIAFLLGVGVVMLQTNVLENLGLASIGGATVIALILGFAGREVLSNIMSSLQIAFTKSARIGDTILFEDEWCTVERIDFTYLTLRTWDKRRIIAPVTRFVSEPFENWSKKDSSMIRTVYLVLDHRAPVDTLRQAFQKYVESDDRVIDKEEAATEVLKHDRDGIHLRFKMNTRGPDTGWAAALAAREYLLKVAAHLEKQTGEPYLPVERELQIESQREGLANQRG